jgi:exosortase E/protease (VPEID-CTERM system)
MMSTGLPTDPPVQRASLATNAHLWLAVPGCLVLELLFLSSARSSDGFGSSVLAHAFINSGQKSDIMRGALTFMICLAVSGWVTSSKAALRSVLPRKPQISVVLLIVHFFGLALCIGYPWLLSQAGIAGTWLAEGSPRLVLLAATALTGILSVFPSRVLVAYVAHIAWQAWMFAAAVSVMLKPAATFFWSATPYLSEITFSLVQMLLRLIGRRIISLPDQLIIGTESFTVRIAQGCSGMEGIVIICIISISYLWFARNSYSFPQAIVVVPAALAFSYLLNAIRITVLILIGDAGAPVVAIDGFHSQAGWLALTLTMVLFWVILNKVPWFEAKPEGFMVDTGKGPIQ